MSIGNIVALFPVVMLVGCSSDSDNFLTEELLNFNSLDRGFSSLQMESPKRLTAIRNQVDLEQVWGSISSQPAPSIERGLSTIVVAEMGTRAGTGVAEIVVESVINKTEHIEALVTSYVPGPGCLTDDAISTPFHVVQFDSILPVLFQERLEVVQCE